MASTVFLTLGLRTVMIARPATYEDLRAQIRTQFPEVSAVYSVAVVFQPANVNGGLLQNWVEVDASAYGAVHDGAELFVNVVHPLTKEYILPLPDRPIPNHRRRKQVRRTDGDGRRFREEAGDHDATTQGDQVSKFRPRGASSGPRGVSHTFFNSSLSLELEQLGGDAFGNGWGGASGRFRRSTKLVPNLKDCKEAVGRSVGESNFYADDEEEQTADFELGLQQPQYQDQDQPPQATEAGWYAGGEYAPGTENPGETEAQHLAGGLEENEDEGKTTTRFHSEGANRNWFAAPHSSEDPFVDSPRSRRGHLIPTSPQWGETRRVGQQWGVYRTPSPKDWGPYHVERHKVPVYIRGRAFSPVDSGSETWGANPRGWNAQSSEMSVADQESSRIVAGQGDHPEAGHLTNGTQANGGHTNGAHTNGELVNGELTNGYPAARSEVSHNPQPQAHHRGASPWSPPRGWSNGYHRPQYPRIQGCHSYGQPNYKAPGGSRPRPDPAEVTYGSPRPRTQGSHTGWTTIGRKKKTWTDHALQEQSDPEGEPGPNANDQAWYGTPPLPNNSYRTTGYGGASKHTGFMRHDTNNYQQKQRRGPETWGSDFWGGPPPKRAQRGALAHGDTPASKHWQ